MLTEFTRIAAGIIAASILRFLIHQFWVISADYFLNPLVKNFYEHVRLWAQKQGHPHLNAMKCPDCAEALKNLPD